MFNYLAPAGTPVKISDLVSLLMSHDKGVGALENFHIGIREKFRVKHSFFISTGRAAMTFLLQQMKQLAPQSRKWEVIIPSYTCYSVPASIINAGFTPRICDIDKQTLGYNLDKLRDTDFNNIFAIITSNLYGIPNDLEQIERIAKENNVYLIDDAAQSMGATINGRYSGTFGDAGIYSLDKGKNITSINGGIIVTNNDRLASALEDAYLKLPDSTATNSVLDLAKLFIYAMLLPPNRYWLLSYLPFIGLGKTNYTTDFTAVKYSPRLATIGYKLFSQLDEISRVRTNNATKIIDALRGQHDLIFPACPASSASPVYLRLPILFANTQTRDAALQALNHGGIGATGSYPLSIRQIPELQFLFSQDADSYEIGEEVSNTILTLPTHPFVRQAHIDKVTHILDSILTTAN